MSAIASPKAFAGSGVIAVLFFLAAAGGVSPASAAHYQNGDKIQLTGLVTDDAGKPIADVQVVLEAARSYISLRELRRAEKDVRRVSALTNGRGEYSIETDYMRLRAYPFTREVHDFIEQHERIYVVEQNRDAQMLSLLKLDLRPELTTRMRSISHLDGLPLDARSVTDELSTMEGK